MRLIDLFEDEGEQVAHNISPADMEVVYQALKDKGELDVADVVPLAQELADEFGGYSRNAGSARFVINRMHVIMHGMAPLGVTEHSAQQFFQPARPLIAFMAEKGYNPQEAINMAKDEARTRMTKRKKAEAVKVMAAYYKQIKPTLTPQQDKAVRAARDQIVQGLETGATPEDVFGQFA